jgi:hypothetical protein
MLRIEVWDEVSPINGVDAKRIFEMRDDLVKARGDIFLVKQGNQVMQIEIGAIIKANYGFDSNLSIKEVAEQYLAKREEEEAKVQEEQLTIEELQEQVAMLSYQVMMMEANVGEDE